MSKLPIFGTPITPAHLLDELEGESFCISYATKRDLEVERIIEIAGTMVMLDNGAFTAWKKGGDEPFLRQEYLDGYHRWAKHVMARCPQAVGVVADTITGTTEQNRELYRTTALDRERAMVVFHMHESDAYLRELLGAGFFSVAIGSSGEYAKVGTPEWHARITEIMTIVNSAPTRPHIHMMRAQAQHHRYDFDSSDSTNLAVNHCRYKSTGPGYVRRFADRIHAQVNA